ncbi:ATP-dependent nuclease [Herbaspirillum huttiense]|uniref:ATP-dependent nuclease n=1 Tax=Herbaspirillum huttiense TaxID=863372 RepID=UPI002176C274|nr:AAA family ATPase [Herbaspirillum huttiense]UWE15669.1 AAA family ATPase [Herbaspirillum huttiense]
MQNNDIPRSMYRNNCRSENGGSMATGKKTAIEKTVEIAPRARLHKLIIRNFRAIGASPVTIELDDIVVLVGPNNAGKSSVLRAYEVVMQAGKDGHLSLEDFPNGQLPTREDPASFPTIELETVLFQDSRPPAERWVDTRDNGDRHVRERWIWADVGAPKKIGFDVTAARWDENHGPWGAAGVAQPNRPEPHRIEAFEDPAKQGADIVNLLQEAIKERVKEFQQRSANGEEKNDYDKLLDTVADLQKRVASSADEAITEVKKALSTSIAEVFPGYTISLDARPEDDLEKAISLCKSIPLLRMGPYDGHQATLDRQGSGARRTLLWTALRILAEHKHRPKIGDAHAERPHVLLLDEPEMCLHPNAIRDACNVLYSLPDNGKWQVMVTTHSPIFIDLSRDNTSIVRVERTASGNVTGTTIFRPNRVKLSSEEKEELKLLNMFDPYVAEFFFGGQVVIVEGDTEHSAFNELIQSNRDKYKNIHIVRARGKFTIVALCKILNQFGNPYAVLHDADTPTIKNKKGETRKNPAWAANIQIAEAVAAAPGENAVLVASLENFEQAMFGSNASGEKPYSAWANVRRDAKIRQRVGQLLDYLIGVGDEPPETTLRWNDISILESAVTL